MSKQPHKILKNLRVFGIGAKGNALAMAEDGKIVFVPYVAPGDLIDARVIKKRKNYTHAQAIKIHEPSKNRVDPKCVHFTQCGGCKWQHLNYSEQLHYKQNEVLENLKRIGGVVPETIDQIIGSQKVYEYRNKMEFSFSDVRWIETSEIESGEIFDRRGLGFHKPGMWDKIIDLEHCHLQASPSDAIRKFCKEEGIRQGLSFFNPRAHTGALRTLMIRNSNQGDLMVLIQFHTATKAEINSYLTAIATKFEEITSLLYVINTKANDTLYDQEIITFKGRPYIEERMRGLKFRVDAKSFYQTNSTQAERLYEVAADFADLQGSEVVYDLYTGTGTIAQFIAANAAKVVGVEAVPEAIEKAKENAVLNKIENVFFEVGDMKTVFNPDFINRHGRADVVITDPPRDGMHAEVVQQLLDLSPKKIVYVSCNSATQARDLQLLSEKYKVVRSRAVDLFPQTHHIENVVLLQKI